jgi:hypothetical protein
MLEPFLEYGFEDFPSSSFDKCQAVAIKWVWIHGHKAFVIAVRHWRHCEFESLDATAQFNVHSEKPTFNVELLHAQSPLQVVNFFTDIWMRMGCEYYD